MQESVTGRIVVRSRLGRAEERQWDVEDVDWFVHSLQYASAMMRMQFEGFNNCYGGDIKYAA